jgi:tetratricopeptide (TPR) repeat protein
MLLEQWPGNAQLQILRGSLIQLQDLPAASLDDAKQALQVAIDLDPSSPAASIELGHFLDSVEDDPKAASKAYLKAIAEARRLLIEGLIGHAKALLQLDQKEEALKCLSELLDLTAVTAGKRAKSVNGHGIIKRSPTGRITILDVQGPYAEQIEDLVDAALATD